MTPEEQLVTDAQLLVKRLERLSADSLWARRASGCRGALLKALDEAGVLDSVEPKESTQPLDTERLRFLMQFGYTMLEKAAREIPYRP
jgi:hypothetical protein